MNDSQQQGFYEPVIETVTQLILKADAYKKKPNGQLKLKPALCVHYQLSLFQYPQEIDDIGSIIQYERQVPESNEPMIAMLKKEASLSLWEHFPRNYECIYNKFGEKLAFKRDLTLIIRNVTRQVRDEQLNAFDEHREPPISELSFSSDFECGNLHFVFKERKQQIYYLLLQNDVNTHGFNFWFFFNIRSTIPRKCTFIIVNFSRPVCFQKDVSILTYSVTKKQYQRRIGFYTDVSQFCRCDAQQNYWSLLFEYQFDYDDDVYFSLALPYSYSKAINFLKGVNLLTKNHLFFIDLVGKSPLGNMIPLIKILKQHRNCKKFIIITARQHPSETVSSFACESIIKKLVCKNSLSNALLQRFKFIILPMINVDGVIHGNSRTNLMGYDLNRCWDRSGIIQSIECEQIWKQIQNIQAEGNIVWSFDLHGHSKEHGFFAYFSEENQKSLILSHHLSNNKMFRANKCVYEVGASKRQSIRGQMYQRMKIKNAVTIEISLFGSYDQNQRFFHFQSSHFDRIATSILQSLLQTQKLSEKKMFKLKNWQQIIHKMGQTHENDKEVDSDSNPQGDYLKKQQRKQVQQVAIKQKHKSQSKQPLISNQFTRKRAKTRIDQNSKQKSLSQRDSPLKTSNPVRILTKTEKKFKSPQIRSRIERSELFNITYTNRFRSSDKCVIIQSHDFQGHPNMVNAWYDEKTQKVQQKQLKRSPVIVNNNQNEAQTSLKKSLDMRRRIKFAFERRHKTQSQRDTYSSNLIGPQNITKINAIVYPTIREKEMLDVHCNLKSKRQLTKQLRNQSFGINLHHSRFQSSFYLKGKNS